MYIFQCAILQRWMIWCQRIVRQILFQRRDSDVTITFLLITIFDPNKLNKDKQKKWGFPVWKWENNPSSENYFLYSIFLTHLILLAAHCVSIEFEDHKEGMNTNMNTAAARAAGAEWTVQSWTSLTLSWVSLPCQSCHIWKFSDWMLSSGSISSSLNNDD